MITFKMYSLSNFYILNTAYSHHAILYMPPTYLFDSWKCIGFDPFCPFTRPPLPPLSSSNQSSDSQFSFVRFML